MRSCLVHPTSTGKSQSLGDLRPPHPCPPGIRHAIEQASQSIAAGVEATADKDDFHKSRRVQTEVASSGSKEAGYGRRGVRRRLTGGCGEGPRPTPNTSAELAVDQ